MGPAGGGFLRQFDAFAKPLKDFRVKTVSGALVLKLDTMDATGEQQFNVEHEIYKTAVTTEGGLISPSTISPVNDLVKINTTKDPNYCGSCYGAESETRKCCNSCDEVQKAYAEKRWNFKDTSAFEQCRNNIWNNVVSRLGSEGCRFNGQLRVNKVAGSFHIAPGHSYSENHVHVHNIQSLGLVQFNISHNIKQLRFGDYYPGQINPLDDKNVSIEQHSQMVSYYLKLVPTMYNPYSAVNRHEKTIKTNQYSVTWHVRGTPLSNTGSGLPGLFFNYEIAPILVKISEDKKSFLHFLTNTCAIIGGVFTVASLFDAFIYQSSCILQKRASGHHR